jgi:hypothetical protein
MLLLPFQLKVQEAFEGGANGCTGPQDGGYEYD